MSSVNYRFKALTVGLAIDLLLSSGLPALAQLPLGDTTFSSEQITFEESFTPPGDGQPKDTSGAGSRDGLRCSANEQPIRPLMPKRNYGLTFQERPSIFIYLPKTSARQVLLAFRDEAGKYYERAFLPIDNNAQIVSFQLPDDKSPLTVGKNYQWSLVIVCQETVQPDDPVFRGWVQRVGKSPELDRELAAKPVIEQLAWYGANGYWYDLMQTMVQARQTHPDSRQLMSLWERLLQSVGLGAIAASQ
ncbi:MAG TPA: DUF928 domain-containing protein [Leptolyngbyaceae cyanobacterium]